MVDADWDDEGPLEDWEYPEEDDPDEQSTTTTCPHCRAEMFDDTVQCPHCGEYLTREFAGSGWPAWVYIGAIAALIGMVASLWYIC